MTRGDADRTVDPAAVPTLSLVFGFGPMLPIVATGIGALALPDPLRAVAIVAGIGWATAILLFIAGVRRGYGFAVAAQPQIGTLVATFAIFFAGLLAIPFFLLSPVIGIMLLILGYAGVALLDPLAARRGDAPRHFAKLRPPQMGVGVVGLVLLAAACLSAVP